MASSKSIGKNLSAFRLVSPRWASTAFSGEGARKYGGRWNSPGRPLVYLGGSRALCALELLVHLTSPGSRRKPYCFMEATFPANEILTLSPRDLPENWRESPTAKETRRLGDHWLTKGEFLALQVPSVLVPEEWNFLINPSHPRFSKIALSGVTNFRFDPRL